MGTFYILKIQQLVHTQLSLNMYLVQRYLLLEQQQKTAIIQASANDGTNPDMIEIQTGGDVDDTSPQRRESRYKR